MMVQRQEARRQAAKRLQEDRTPRLFRGLPLRRGLAWLIVGALTMLGTLAGPSFAYAQQIGTASGLPVPRYVSLKSDRVNLREGPSKDHRTNWIFERAGLPVEITAEFETWRKVRDSEGSEGWVLHSLLSGRRTALVTPWKKDGPAVTVFSKPSDTSQPEARLEPNVLANIRSCDKTWCRVNGDGFDGFVRQAALWGVYPNESIE